MRLIFAGTPDFSVPALQAIINAGHEIVAVYTQPDRKKGRGQKVIFSPVKICALENDIPVFQPNTLKTPDNQKEIAELNADVMVVVAYGMILPKEILETPRFGCLNIHASLLPRWRGAAPIQRAIQMQDEQTGVCIMQMDEGLDTGDVLLESKIDISLDDTSLTLHDKLAKLGANALIETLDNLNEKQSQASEQSDQGSTYAKKINKSEAKIDWSKTAKEIDCTIRAFNPWPVCETSLNGERIRLWMSQLGTPGEFQSNEKVAPGKIIRIEKNHFSVACGEGYIQINKLQREGGKPLTASEFINGYNDLSSESISNTNIAFSSDY